MKHLLCFSIIGVLCVSLGISLYFLFTEPKDINNENIFSCLVDEDCVLISRLDSTCSPSYPISAVNKKYGKIIQDYEIMTIKISCVPTPEMMEYKGPDYKAICETNTCILKIA